jgi:hypothetical protein
MGFHRTADKNPEAYKPYTREQAAADGRTFYFTGEPCKHGHTAPRYVSTTGCLDCLTKFRRLKAKNPHTHDLVPYSCPTLWRSKRLDGEQLDGLAKYLQTCIDAYVAHLLPPVCKTCDGERYVPETGGSNAWVVCPACGGVPMGTVKMIGVDP